MIILGTSDFIVSPIKGRSSSTDSFTKRAQSYCGHEFAPMMKPPPCMKTKTGSLEEQSILAGTVMFRLRHSRSDCVRSGLGSDCWIRPYSKSKPFGKEGAVGLQHKLAWPQERHGNSKAPNSPEACSVNHFVFCVVLEKLGGREPFAERGVLDP